MVLTYGMNFFLLNHFLMRNRYIEFRRTLTVYGRLACIVAALSACPFRVCRCFFVYLFSPSVRCMPFSSRFFCLQG